MASAVIHMAVCKKVNETLKMNERYLLLGSIAPDVAKIVKIPRDTTHFVTKINSDTPNIEAFIKKYHNKLKNPFEIGYLIHLITDVLWFDEFLPNYIKGMEVTDKTGRKFYLSGSQVTDIIYNDYTNLNLQIIDYYNLDFSLFYEKYPLPFSQIEEFKNSYYKPLLDKMGNIMSRTNSYNFMLDKVNITHFIEYATVYVLDELKRLNII